jgi:hypothetical protein
MHDGKVARHEWHLIKPFFVENEACEYWSLLPLMTFFRPSEKSQNLLLLSNG